MLGQASKRNSEVSFRLSKTPMKIRFDREESRLTAKSRNFLLRKGTMEFTEQKQEASLEVLQELVPITPNNLHRETTGREGLLPSMNKDILSETLHSSRLFNPTPEDIERKEKEREQIELLQYEQAIPQKVQVKTKKSLGFTNSHHRRVKSMPEEVPIIIVDRKEPRKEDTNFKPFEMIDSYSEMKYRITSRFTSPSVDVVKMKLSHNNVEKTKYMNFFDTLTREKLQSVILKDNKWKKQLNSMPKVKVIPKAPEFESEEEAEEEKPAAHVATTLNLLMRPSLASNSLFSKLMGNSGKIRTQRKYDFDKITARWIPPPSQALSSESFIQTREGGAMTTVGSKVWIAGGFNNSTIKSLCYYDIKSNTFATVNLKNFAELDGRFNHSMVAYRDSLIIFGGEVVSGTVFSSRTTSNTVSIIDTSR